jgi:hypothetical protein
MRHLEVIAANGELASILEWPFDFSLTAPNHAPLFQIHGAKYQVVGRDRSGDFFAAVEAAGPIVYVCHEGQAGTVAENIAELFELFVSAPYWRDLLHFSGGGQIVEMRRVLPILEKELLADEPDVETYRALLRRQLALFSSGDVVAKLHECVGRDRDFRIVSPEGEEFDSLFNKFVLEDNPTWRNA